MSQWRQDPVTGRWVVIAPKRSERPHDLASDGPAKEAAATDCPFCPGREAGAGAEILRLPGPPQPWRLRVLANRFPVLGPEGSVERRGDGTFEWLDGVGAHEVVVDSPDHRHSFAELPDDHAADVFRTYRARIRALAADERVAYVQVFRNEGAAAGASLRHPHSQIIATPVIPGAIKEAYHGARRWRARHGGCVFCHLAQAESEDGSRVVLRTHRFLALAPFASGFAWELMVLPLEHGPDFHALEDAALAELASVVKACVGRLKALLGPLPYNYFIHSAPLRHLDGERQFHWHLSIIPRLSQPAGFEWSTGFGINSVAPEDAAERLRRA